MAAEPEHVLELFDTFWFEKTVLTNKNPSTLHSSVMDFTSKTHLVEQFSLDSELLRAPTLQLRSLSDQNLASSVSVFSDYSPSPNSVLTTQKLRPILSGKEVEDFTLERSSENHAEEEDDELATKKKQGHRRRFKKGKTTRSLSDLEFKELKGFMDLGFVFSEEDKDSKLVSLIPGLQRLGRGDSGMGMGTEEQQKEQNKKFDETLICRPYLSEAWDVLDQRKVVNPLLKWRVPAMGNEIDMKDNLRFWAHTVASIVR